MSFVAEMFRRAKRWLTSPHYRRSRRDRERDRMFRRFYEHHGL